MINPGILRLITTPTRVKVRNLTSVISIMISVIMALIMEDKDLYGVLLYSPFQKYMN